MSWDFNGSTDWIGNNWTAPITTIPATIACWFNADAAGSNLINVCNASGGNNLRLIFLSTRDLRLASIDAGTSRTADTTTTASLNTWNHGCAVFASSTSRTVYLNGGGSATNTNSSNPSGFTRLHIGSRRETRVTDNHFDGQIAEVGVWNIGLSPEEVTSLSKGVCCSLVRPQNLVFYAPLIRNLFDYSKTTLSTEAFGSASVDSSQRHPGIYL